jgi:DNA-3-methyladenine glycosylase II
MNSESAILHLEGDPILKKIIRQATIKPFQPSGNVYFELLNSIVSQQLSVKAAETIFQRFCALFPKKIQTPNFYLP